MRKRLITPIPQGVPLPDEGCLNLDGAAVVEVTSEKKDYPSSQHWSQDKYRAGALLMLAFKPFG